ncbi:hypothetical protein BST27_08200 [Mycobacterium intermedium]|uniref:Uncharacterized protein n=1 Tax=Mycobacterium intermedium TaxID=28445 RepID=A0A1E3SDM9_MYCIE|nr:hypothetical protein [Mycobacterium intermedium]MCV6963940.1 hypothetical protein [Mycobacterium intermedium]ODR00241.1 hypothetical protein BHQ20_14080 [Mycobacterium intermedium]OPE51758.1 hypothetical protein BV508_04905 [Mycobacterium intermedium]ORB07825.1 hypothetical protein BST27_08200 [Mycobacterium intermedium]
MSRRAAADAVLLVRALHQGDVPGAYAVAAHADLVHVSVQLAGYVLAVLRHFDTDIDERLQIWLREALLEAGEETP